MDWLDIFREGQWKDFRRFVLEERKDVGSRLAAIRAELRRIGYILVVYETLEPDDEGHIKATERMVGFSVPPRTALGKLVQAYVAMGGNPLSISHFLIPYSSYTKDGVAIVERYPHGGVVFPATGDPTKTQYDGGFSSLESDVARRTGGRKKHSTDRVAFHVDHSRRWVAKEIREKRTDIEARIIKLMDLREQLEQEVIQIILAVGGTVGSLAGVDRRLFESTLNAVSLIHFLDTVFWEGGDGTLDMNNQSENLMHYPFLMNDLDTEANHEL